MSLPLKSTKLLIELALRNAAKLGNSKDPSSITDSKTDSMVLGSRTLLKFHTDFLGCSLLLFCPLLMSGLLPRKEITASVLVSVLLL